MGSPLVGVVERAALDLLSCFSLECGEKKEVSVTIILPGSVTGSSGGSKSDLVFCKVG